jgi:hypothetical protein
MQLTSLATPAEPDGFFAAPVIRLVDAPDEAHERVARALRGARARTGLSEQQVADKLSARGFDVGIPGLRKAESSGSIDLALASALADLYGSTTDCLAGRRLSRQSLPALAPGRS